MPPFQKRNAYNEKVTSGANNHLHRLHRSKAPQGNVTDAYYETGKSFLHKFLSHFLYTAFIDRSSEQDAIVQVSERLRHLALKLFLSLVLWKHWRASIGSASRWEEAREEGAATRGMQEVMGRRESKRKRRQ